MSTWTQVYHNYNTKRVLTLCATAILFALASVSNSWAQAIPAVPLEQAVRTQLKPIQTGPLQVPVIFWGGDVATKLADIDGYFKAERLDVKLYSQDDFKQQVQDALDGKTPFVRGTLAMVKAGQKAFQAAGTDLVVIYQLTWSTGADAMTVRDLIKKPSDLCGKPIALQLYGPHMDFAANVLASAGCSPAQMNFKFYKELTVKTANVDNPVAGFQRDATLAAAMAIVPDANTLTSGGKVGTGAEGSVKGARILVTTKDAPGIVADVYAVRKDWYDANRDRANAFTHALMRADEGLRDLRANQASQQAKYRQLISESATLLAGAPQATGDIEALIGDATFAGYTGNVQFFTGAGTTRSFKNLQDEINSALVAMKLMSAPATLAAANWDYTALAKDLKYVTPAAAATAAPKFDERKAAAAVEKSYSAELNSFSEAQWLFEVEVLFPPNAAEFNPAQYAKQFAQVAKLSQTYGGALMVVEGHSDPMRYSQAQTSGAAREELTAISQAAKNLSLQRAETVRNAIIDYVRSSMSVTLNRSQFTVAGRGLEAPRFKTPQNETEWKANMRVVFRVKRVDAELTSFPGAIKK